MKQTAVEWLESQLTDYLKRIYKQEIEEAKEMEKQQIIDAWIDGNDSEPMETSSYYAEQHYNETFKNK